MMILMQNVSSPSVIGLVARLSKTIHRHSSEELLGMTLRAFVVLGLLYEHDAMPQQELGEIMCLDANGTVLLLHELEDEEYITRRRDPTDRRRHIIEIAPAGRSAFERAERGRDSIEDAVFVGLSAHERKTLHNLISKALEGAASSSTPTENGMVGAAGTPAAAGSSD
jgi:DNA-binding MarR family transcriptional regulator